MKAYEIIECLNHLFSEFDRLAEAAGVEKIKTSGDSYMAVAEFPGRIPIMPSWRPNLLST